MKFKEYEQTSHNIKTGKIVYEIVDDSGAESFSMVFDTLTDTWEVVITSNKNVSIDTYVSRDGILRVFDIVRFPYPAYQRFFKHKSTITCGWCKQEHAKIEQVAQCRAKIKSAEQSAFAKAKQNVKKLIEGIE